MKNRIAKILVLALVFGAGSVQAAPGEVAPRDGNRTTALLLTDPATGKTQRWDSDSAGAAKIAVISFGTASLAVFGEGTVGVAPTKAPVLIGTIDGGGLLRALVSSAFGLEVEIKASVLPTGASTETTLAAILAKIIGAPANEAKQDAANASLVDIELNTDTAQTATEPFVIAVGTTPTLILAASSTRRSATLQNAGEAPIFLGKGAVTTSTGIILGGSTVANDGKGAIAEAFHGDAIFGIVTSGTVNIRVAPESD